jgi:hypothetical protein
VAYLRCMPRRNGATHLVMTPVQLLARIAALIPPPRFPWQRLSGVFAPRRAAARGRGAIWACGESLCNADQAARQEEEKEADGDAARQRIAAGNERGRDVARGWPRERERCGKRPANEPGRRRREAGWFEDRVVASARTNLLGGRFDLRLWRSPSDRRRHFRARGDRGDPRAPRSAHRGAADGASAEPSVRGGVRREWLGPGPSARRRREGGREPRGGRARGSGLAWVIFQSSAHAGGGRGRVRRCGIGLRCPSLLSVTSY